MADKYVSTTSRWYLPLFSAFEQLDITVLTLPASRAELNELGRVCFFHEKTLFFIALNESFLGTKPLFIPV